MVEAAEPIIDSLQSNCLLTGQRIALLIHSFYAITPELERQYIAENQYFSFQSLQLQT